MISLKAVIIEDEKNSREALTNILSDFCENITVYGQAETVQEGIKEILKSSPDIVFLDIELPNESGFELLKYFPEGNFDVIFTTAYNQYAVKAFKMSAIDYLLKPIDLEELRNSIEKVRKKKSLESLKKRVEILQNNLNNTFHKLALPVGDGIIFVELKNIIRLEAQSNYTVFHLTNKEQKMVTRTLKFYDDLLSESNFFRINRKDLINMNFIQKYTKQKRPVITLTDGTNLFLAETKKAKFIATMEM